MASLGSLLINVGANLDAFNAAMGDLDGRLKQAEKDASGAWSGFEALGSRLTSAGTALTAGLTLPIIGIGTAAASAFGEFQSALARVSALGEITGKDLDTLKAQAIDLGAKTQYSAKQAADGMAELAAAGFKTTDVMKAMPGVLDLAASGQMEVGRAAEVAANVMGGFGIKAEGVSHAVDVMAKAAASGSLGVNDLAYTFKYVGPVATAAGVSFEEVAAATTLLSNAGIKGEQAGTTLRGALAKLLDPSREAAQTLERLGVVTTDASGKLLPFSGIIDQLGKSGATTKDIFQIFGQETASGMQALVTAGAPALQTMTKELQNSDGAARKMAETLNGGMGGALERMKGSIETAGIALGESLAPVVIRVAGLIEGFANTLAEWATAFGKLPEPVQTGAIAIAALVAAIGPLLLIAGQVAGAIVSINGAVTVLGPAVATFTGTVGASAAAMGPWILALTAAAVAAYKLWEAYDGAKNAEANLKAVEKTGADALTKLENHLRSHGAAVDEWRDKYKAGKITLTEYQVELRKMGVELGNATKKQADQSTAAKKAKDAQDAVRKALEGAASATSKAGKAHAETATDTEKLTKKSELLFEIAKQLRAEHDKHVRSLAELTIKYGDVANRVPQLIQPTDELNKAVQDLVSNVKTVAPSWISAIDTTSAELQAALGPVRALDQAYATLGITGTKAAQDHAEAARKAYETIRDSGTASATDLAAAWAKYQEAQIEAARAAGTMTAAEAEKALAQVKGKTEKGLAETATVWKGWGGEISGLITGLTGGLNGKLWEGSGSFKEKGTAALISLGKDVATHFGGPFGKEVGGLMDGVLKDLMGGKGFGGLTDRLMAFGESVLQHFLAPVQKAGTELITGVFSDLIGGKGFGGLADAAKNAGKSISDVFGGGSAASAGGIPGTGGAGGTPPPINSGGGGGGATGAAANVAAAGAVIQAIGSIGTWITAIRQEGTQNAIEHNTRYAMFYLGERADGGILGQMFRVQENTQFVQGQLDGLNAKLIDWLSPVPEALSGLNEAMQWALKRFDQIGNDVMYGSASDKAQEAILGEIRDALRNDPNTPILRDIAANTAALRTAAAPQAAGIDVSRMRLQGVLA